MSENNDQSKSGEACQLRAGVDLSEIDVVKLRPDQSVAGYQAAMTLAEAE